MYFHSKKQMKKIQRCFTTLECPQEIITHSGKDVEVPDFGTKGDIEFKEVFLRYRPTTDLVLKDLTFKIKAGEKVGIVGRTAAGKSTMANALCRIVEIEKGQIIIDGHDTKEVPIYSLRDRITVITQEACLFTGTLRFNMDPKGEHSDEHMIALLKRAGLEELLKRDKVDTKGGVTGGKGKKGKGKGGGGKKKKDAPKTGMDVAISEGGSNLSSGERSLLGICRAILRKNKIILLDEATANIDIKTETKIQELIATEFKGCTVLTIAHRLQTIMSSDQIIVMNHGSVKEMGPPNVLKNQPSSEFYKLVQCIQAEEAKCPKEDEDKDKKDKKDKK